MMTSNPVPPVSPIDCIIIGGGAAGSLAAIVLARAGYRVTLVDMHAVYPPEFRCEKMTQNQYQLLEQLGLMHTLTQISTACGIMHVVRAGQVREELDSLEYGFHYQDFVNELRRNIPHGAEFICDRVLNVRTSSDVQEVDLAGGRTLHSRLIVLATGLGNALRSKLGVERKMVQEQHSLCMGFTLRPVGGGVFSFPALTYYSEKPDSGMAYISLFPIGDTMRANLFGYRPYKDPFIAGMREVPIKTLRQVMPRLESFIGDYEVDGDVQTRMIDLYVARNYRKNGLLIIGDAFQTSCPAAGTGLSRVMHDVQCLARHMPSLMSSPGMTAEKLGSFYDDRDKQEADAAASRAAKYTRDFSTSTTLGWRARRAKRLIRPGLAGMLRGYSASS